LVIAAVCFVFHTPAIAADARPNILVILADDLGFADVGCFGSEIKTPNLDRLAEGGLRFTQFYNTAKCETTRISLLTGLYPNEAGYTSLSHGVTMAQVMRDAGYFTAAVGKWHLDDQPTDHGFERYFGHLSGSTNYFTGDNTFRLNGKAWEVPKENFYNTTANADYAIQFIDEAGVSGKPMFMYLAFNAPHYPLQCSEEDYAKYENTYKVGWDAIRAERIKKQQALGIFGDQSVTPAPRPDDVAAWKDVDASEQEWEAKRMAVYAAMVDRLDIEIGRVIDHLKQVGMLDNTLVLFMSDNGACPFERTKGKQYEPWDSRGHWTYSKGWAHVGNTPYRLYKQNQHEGGITSPTIAYWPAGLKAKAGSLTDQPAHLIDVMATVVELGNTSYPMKDHQGPVKPFQGLSLMPILEGKLRKPHQDLFFSFAQNRGIREGNMKLVSEPGGQWELYDLSKDRTELNDLSAKNPALVQTLSAKWMQWSENVNKSDSKGRRSGKDKSEDE